MADESAVLRVQNVSSVDCYDEMTEMTSLRDTLANLTLSLQRVVPPSTDGDSTALFFGTPQTGRHLGIERLATQAGGAAATQWDSGIEALGFELANEMSNALKARG